MTVPEMARSSPTSVCQPDASSKAAGPRFGSFYRVSQSPLEVEAGVRKLKVYCTPYSASSSRAAVL